jgi:hypothetical protein
MQHDPCLHRGIRVSLTGLDSTGATRVFIFHHAIRRLAVDRSDGTIANVFGPGKSVHIDQCYETAENHVKMFLPDDAEELLKKRFQLINVNENPLPILRVHDNDSP